MGKRGARRRTFYCTTFVPVELYIICIYYLIQQINNPLYGQLGKKLSRTEHNSQHVLGQDRGLEPRASKDWISLDVGLSLLWLLFLRQIC